MKPMDASNIEAIYPLSPAQETLLNESAGSSDKAANCGQATLLLRRQVDALELELAWQRIVANHPVLRTSFVWKRVAKPLQVVQRQVQIHLEQDDWSELPQDQQDESLHSHQQSQLAGGFNLSLVPLARLALYRTGYSQVLVLTYHRLALDRVSVSVLLRELLAACDGRGGVQESQTGQDRSFQSYVMRLENYDWTRAESFWRESLEGVPAPSHIAYDKAIDAFSETPTAYSNRAVSLPAHTSGALQSLLDEYDLAACDLAAGALAIITSRYSGNDDIVIGIAVSGRQADLLPVNSIADLKVGPYANVLPIRVTIPQRLSTINWLKQIAGQRQSLAAYDCCSVDQIKQWAGLPASSPLFYACVNINEASDWKRLLDSDSSLQSYEVTEPMGCELSVELCTEQAFKLSVGFAAARIGEDVIERLLGHLGTLLAAISTDLDRRVDSLPILTEHESRQLLVEWNQTVREYPRGLCINQMFEQQVEHAPDAIAVIFADQKLTYGEINERANQLSHHLLSLGAGPESFVALYLERSVEMIVALLAIAKAGAAYVPLDTTYPLERIAFVLEEIQASIILTQDSLVYELPACWAQIICLDSDSNQVADQSVENPVNKADPDNLAYVMYTSGSTGWPKGVCVTHRNVARLVKGNYFADLSRDHVLLQLAPISFDASTLEVWGALLNGARLAVMPPEPPTLADIGKALSEFHVTTLWLTAGLFHLIVDERLEALKGLRQLLAGGDALSAHHVKKALQALDGCAVINGYGPTESTTFACCHRMSSAGDLKSSSVPIGRPIANTQVYILDKFLRPLPVGAAGELYIGGDGLARSYLNRPELTAEKFVPNPFGSDPGSRLYKTGDLCRYVVEGEIEFLGRSDYQVKIRGYRVEPGEIEAALNQHPCIRESVVIASEKSFADKRLIAYLVPDAEASFTPMDVQDYLNGKLPDYMIPSHLVVLDSLPLTANGKVDRAALPPPDGLEVISQPAFVAPRTDVEELLASVWAEVLQVENVGIEDNFFQSGGQSLTAIQVISRVRDLFLIEVPLRCIFEAPTVSRFAEVLVEFEQSPGQIASVARLRKQVNRMAPGEVQARINE
jgi:surfactin family lipopeptide synthetase C